MRMDGLWRLCDDGILRPVFRATVLAANGRRVAVDFLADTGADRTVLCAELFRELGLTPISDPSRLEGVGGQVESFVVETDIRIIRETGEPISIKGKYAAFTDPSALDMNVLGRDITNLFPLIVDRPGDTVCLLGPGHRYVVVES
jgi:predicted aspartyl protease